MANKTEIRILCAENAGFCFGVRRAVDTVLELSKSTGKKIYSIGELIHNGVFLKRLEKDNIFCVEEQDLPSLEKDKDNIVLVVRAHGVTRQLVEYLDKAGFTYVDATCPYVLRIHDIVDKNTHDAALCIIMGDKAHPEVIGTQSYSHCDAVVCGNEEELLATVKEKLINNEQCFVLTSQTTYNNEKYVNCQKVAQKLYTNSKIFDTICSVTEKRQNEVVSIASKSDCVLVVGGRKSSNTKKLFDIASNYCKGTFLVEQADELDKSRIMQLYHEAVLRNSKLFTVGITAGASTPDDILEEVKAGVLHILNSGETNKMQNTEINDSMSFEEMLDASFKRLRTGETVKGIVTAVTPTEVQLDLGVKYTGIIPFAEMTMDSSAKLEDLVKVDDEIEAIVVKSNDVEGTVLLSKTKIDAAKYWDVIEEAANADEILTGKVVETTKGGIAVLAKNIRVFIPISQTTLPRSETPYEEKDLQVFMGQTVSFKIISVEKARKRVVGSMRAAARVEREAAEAKFWEGAYEGQKFTGKVKSITNYGAFVDLGGVDGMVHVSELSWKRIKNPSEVVSVGDEIDVFIKALDKENKRISLGYKVDAENPWVILSEKYNEGDVVDAKVVGLTPFGAFAEIIPGIDGLIHISQISDKKIAKPADELSVGDNVTAKITAIDYEAKRVSLSMRALLEPAEEAVEEAVEEAAKEVAEEATEETAE